ncbi:MAG: hypothetical protein CVV44_06235 [Spirochaetae bacterium HGW-Spirochaetae-1]|jgi:hypothetical protein|nr:MAG: hypothetical protein CVV44_06235 [Spirochaetae bacterium HGW-Spirochaetae-1]
MAEIKVYYEQETELMTIFWQPPRKNQICSELDDGIILIKDAATNEPIGIELLSYKPEDNRISGISLQIDKVSA